MEEISYYFNGDLEDFLSSKKKSYSIDFNKFNQEFEFVIAILENSLICSNRDYPLFYIQHLKSIFDVDLKTSPDKSIAKLWCVDIYDLDFQKSINSRFYTQEIANTFNEYQALQISDFDEVEEGFIYKEELSVSGIGNYLFPKHGNKLKKILSKRRLLKDRFYDRNFDISTLIDGEKIIHYQNIVDEYFQYKGTVVGDDLSIHSWFEDYLMKIKNFLSLNLPIKGIYSIDSFVSDNKVIFMSEINNRKTMGHIAHRIKEAHFSNYKILKTLLISNKRIKNKTYKIDIEGIELISPPSNVFGFYIIAANSKKELKAKELQLYTFILD